MTYLKKICLFLRTYQWGPDDIFEENICLFLRTYQRGPDDIFEENMCISSNISEGP